uniref:Apurinic/apyrimidinic endodeoxyribonuclease 1 n=13 Tax=Simiiformes TaxID=314293 RepID=G3V574_HUMAN
MPKRGKKGAPFASS